MSALVLSPELVAVLSGERRWCVEHGSMLDVLPLLEPNSLDACVCDPPYEFGFMGRAWDRSGIAFDPETWRAVLRVLKPGGHLLAFGGARTAHRIACAIEDAGFEIRDSLEWLYGSGFPKSLNVGKAIDASDAPEMRRARQLRFTEWMRSTGLSSSQIDELTGTVMGGHYLTAASQPAIATREHFEKLRPHIAVEVPAWVEEAINQRTLESEQVKSRPVIDEQENWSPSNTFSGIGVRETFAVTGPATDPAREWEGWGTALKPGHEPIILARKPLEGTVAANVLKHGTGALNIDACRVPHGSPADLAAHEAQVAAIKARGGAMDNSWKNSSDLANANDVKTEGRWPPNVLLTHSAACRVVGERAIKANPTWDTPNRNTEPSSFTGAEVSKVRHAAEVVPEYACAEDCPVRELDQQSGETASVASTELPTEPNLKNNVYGRGMGGYAKNQHSDAGTASRYFPQSQWNAELDDVGRFAEAAEAEVGSRDAVAYECAEDCPVRKLDEQSGDRGTSSGNERTSSEMFFDGGGGFSKRDRAVGFGDTGTASRYFPQSQWNPDLDDVAPFLYTAKANRSERDRGLERFRRRSAGELVDRVDDSAGTQSPRAGAGRKSGMRNVHPTVKPVEVLAWLVRLVTPPRGVVLDPFCGSGSCGVAAMLEDFRYLGIELNDTVKEPFVTMARSRIEWVIGGGYAREIRPELAATDDDEPRQRSLF